jgi:hypothetical protein
MTVYSRTLCINGNQENVNNFLQLYIAYQQKSRPSHECLQVYIAYQQKPRIGTGVFICSFTLCINWNQE